MTSMMIAFAVCTLALAATFVWALLHEQAAHRAEVATLLQRIQAPAVAVAQHVQEHEPDPVDEDGEPVPDPAFTNIP